jgi:hypothetical protein
MKFDEAIEMLRPVAEAITIESTRRLPASDDMDDETQCIHGLTTIMSFIMAFGLADDKSDFMEFSLIVGFDALAIGRPDNGERN